MIFAEATAQASDETFTEVMDHGAQGFEALGAAILVVGGDLVLHPRGGGRATVRVVSTGLPRTVAVAPTLDNVLVLGLIVVIRTFLSFSLETEIEGVAPWRRALLGGAGTIRRASASALESETPP